MALLEIRNLSLDFVSGKGRLRAVDDVTLRLDRGQVLCLMGESGSGKTATALSIARLLPTPPAEYAEGNILLGGQDVLQMDTAQLHAMRGSLVSYIFQEPAASLNPIMSIRRQIKEALRLHRREKANDVEVIRLLKLVGIAAPESRLKDYPFQMSGGMQQRVMIAIALSSEPNLLVADEPTTALDVTIQAQILELLREFKLRLGMSILLITHNPGIASEMGDEIAVMYAGQILEQAPAAEILDQPLHPYTRALLASMPQLDNGKARLEAIPGNVPRPGHYPPGCRFYDRCPTRKPECASTMPESREVRPGRWVRCLYAG